MTHLTNWEILSFFNRSWIKTCFQLWCIQLSCIQDGEYLEIELFVTHAQKKHLLKTEI